MQYPPKDSVSVEFAWDPLLILPWEERLLGRCHICHKGLRRLKIERLHVLASLGPVEGLVFFGGDSTGSLAFGRRGAV